MKIKLTQEEALALYRILCRWEATGEFAASGEAETRLLWDLQCVLEKELEPVNEDITKRLV